MSRLAQEWNDVGVGCSRLGKPFVRNFAVAAVDVVSGYITVYGYTCI